LKVNKGKIVQYTNNNKQTNPKQNKTKQKTYSDLEPAGKKKPKKTERRNRPTKVPDSGITRRRL